ncbi:hypothetical protein K470DRAFT_259140 [Piedraia hortae CBS 480.64]|uniref:Glycine zipper 2TM domain-containing protein n=1 Tax=Piedraia hortae CBS 480.64 TaxID=1314780 RepID=A0A6A7BVE6_9PEZI|nr:hypothetical protein K470DRAFT_259140 [Piedraia hortae CBS 480.64]
MPVRFSLLLRFGGGLSIRSAAALPSPARPVFFIASHCHRTMPSSIMDITYSDPRTGERARDRRRVQEIPYDQVENLRRQGIDCIMRGDSVPRNDREGVPRMVRDDDALFERDQALARRYRDEYDGQRVAPYNRRRKSYDDYDDYSDEEYDHRRRDRDERHRHHRRHDDRRGSNAKKDDVLWWSMRNRDEANFLERNLDSSYDGLLASAAGAALGAVTARSFAGEEKSKMKMVGGAVIGAAMFNALENKWRVSQERDVRNLDERRKESR